MIEPLSERRFSILVSLNWLRLSDHNRVSQHVADSLSIAAEGHC